MHIRIIAKNHWKITAWLNAASVKQQVAGPWSAFLVFSFQQNNCIYFLHARAQEDINSGGSSQMSFKTGVLKISQNSEGRQPWPKACNFAKKEALIQVLFCELSKEMSFWLNTSERLFLCIKPEHFTVFKHWFRELPKSILVFTDVCNFSATSICYLKQNVEDLFTWKKWQNIWKCQRVYFTWLFENKL